jgi:uncharacterized protein YjiK
VKKLTILTAVLLILTTSLTCYFWFKKELDDVAQNGPLSTTSIDKKSSLPVFDSVLAAGISWDFDNDGYFVSTDQPHTLLPSNEAQLLVVDQQLSTILQTITLPTDGDLEGVAYIGNGEVAAISEVGTLYYFKQDETGRWALANSVMAFANNKVRKLASLAYDPQNQHLYTAEKEGTKTVYQLSRSGEQLSRFELSIDHLKSASSASLSDDYTVAGMAYRDQALYFFSEAYSTLFQYDLNRRMVTQAFGINNIHESAGVTFRHDTLVLVGDQENYLPPPQFYKVDMPSSTPLTTASR